MLTEHHVLIVDDQPLIRKVLKSMLFSHGGKRISEAANGEEARTIMRSQPATLILCDINMSPGTGFDFLHDLRSGTMGAADVPVIFLTCNVETAMVEKAAEMGVNGYLLKPVSGEKLYATIDNVLREHAAHC